jgi:hypothetical protein
MLEWLSDGSRGLIEAAGLSGLPTLFGRVLRPLSPHVALVDNRYVQKAAEGGKDRVMWTAIALSRRPDG